MQIGVNALVIDNALIADALSSFWVSLMPVSTSKVEDKPDGAVNPRVLEVSLRELEFYVSRFPVDGWLEMPLPLWQWLLHKR